MRELINALEYAVVTCEGTIGVHDLPYDASESLTPADASGASPEEGQLARIEQTEILKALQQFGGNRTKAAEYLGINRKTLREKLRKYHLESSE